jgi:hypothetical protein
MNSLEVSNIGLCDASAPIKSIVLISHERYLRAQKASLGRKAGKMGNDRHRRRLPAALLMCHGLSFPHQGNHFFDAPRPERFKRYLVEHDKVAQGA